MKKIISIFLAISILLGSMSLGISASATEAGAFDTNFELENVDESYPFIFIRGMDPNALFMNYGTSEQERATNFFDANGFVSAILKSLWNNLLKRDSEEVAEPIIEFAEHAIGNLAYDKDGNSVHDLDLPRYPLALSNYPSMVNNIMRFSFHESGVMRTAIEKYGADAVYYFAYDWRRNPLELADELQEMIDRAKNEHNADKVNLVNFSMGGIVHSSYIYKHGYEDLNGNLIIASAFFGAHFVSDLFQGKFQITGETLTNFFDYHGGGFFARAAGALGLFNPLANLAMDLIDQSREHVYEDFIRDNLATVPGFWSAVPLGHHDACIEYMFPTDELKEEYAGALENIYALKEMREGLGEVMNDMVDDGVKVGIVAAYDVPHMPLFECSNMSGDGTIDSESMFGYAKVAPFNKSLPEDYIASNPNKLSPDRCVDLSDVILPDHTWVLKGTPHGGGSYGGDINELLFWILEYDGQANVNSYSRYPQFMISGRDESLRPF